MIKFYSVTTCHVSSRRWTTQHAKQALITAALAFMMFGECGRSGWNVQVDSRYPLSK